MTGDYTLTVKLISESLGAFETMCESDVIVTKESYEKSGDGMAADPVGTGPYMVTEYVTGSKAVLEENEEFWMDKSKEAKPIDAVAHNVDIIEFNFLTETTQMALAVENGTVQMGLWLNESIVEDCSAVDGIVTDSLMSPQICEILFNESSKSPCDDVNLRKAIAYCVDNQAVIRCWFHSKGTRKRRTAGLQSGVGDRIRLLSIRCRQGERVPCSFRLQRRDIKDHDHEPSVL